MMRPQAAPLRSSALVGGAAGRLGGQLGGLLGDVAAPGLAVLGGADAGGLGSLLPDDEIGVGREEGQALADELADRLELVVDHELGQVGLELVDDLVAAQ